MRRSPSAGLDNWGALISFTAMDNTQYQQAFDRASEMMGMCPDLEPKSALKQAANDLGIPYGPEMEAFVTWACAKIDDDPDHDSGDDTRYHEPP